MFASNGWCFTWAVTAAGATHRCLRKPDPETIWKHLRESDVTHLCGATTLLVMLEREEAAKPGKFAGEVRVYTGSDAPPSQALLQRMAELGMDVHHMYGMTETYGPAVLCEWRAEWNNLSIPEQAQLKTRVGVGTLIAEEVRVVDMDGRDVVADGVALGQILIRGNNVMMGYYRDLESTQDVLLGGGWFRTRDIGVMHPDGYVELSDRLRIRDVIISGGETIATVEVAQVLGMHPDILEVAVVAGPHSELGEVPVAFVTLRAGAVADEAALIEHSRRHLARFKIPNRFVFGDLPKTGTGKIKKYALREGA
jgi:fatty-acyl-CoA synthase